MAGEWTRGRPSHLTLPRVEDMGVDPTQSNEFGCGAAHWLGISPLGRAEDGGLVPLAIWLRARGVDFSLPQRQGHTALHKAAWGGHLPLLSHLRTVHGLLDAPDNAGNYAADLADMAATPRHARAALYLRASCGEEEVASRALLGVSAAASRGEIRAAYLEKARRTHPDKNGEGFRAVRRAYEHLALEDGVGKQKNPTHCEKLMLLATGGRPGQEGLFKARLLAVVMEYGDAGLALSNVKKKWAQVWPNAPFPPTHGTHHKKGKSLAQYIIQNAGDVVDIKMVGDKGESRLVPKSTTRDRLLCGTLDIEIT